MRAEERQDFTGGRGGGAGGGSEGKGADAAVRRRAGPEARGTKLGQLLSTDMLATR